MIYTNNWTFIHIPKNGGTNFRFHALKHGAQEPLESNSDTWRTTWQHAPASYWTNRNNFIAIVRNPYSRMVSIYEHVRKVWNIKATFEEYVTSPKPVFEGLWGWNTNQVDFITKDTKVYKLETELSDLEKYVGFEFTHTCYNSTNHSNYIEYYTKNTQDYVRWMYERDFETFNYGEKI